MVDFFELVVRAEERSEYGRRQLIPALAVDLESLNEIFAGDNFIGMGQKGVAGGPDGVLVQTQLFKVRVEDGRCLSLGSPRRRTITYFGDGALTRFGHIRYQIRNLQLQNGNSNSQYDAILIHENPTDPSNGVERGRLVHAYGQQSPCCSS